MAMAALTVSGVISCYLMAVQRSEWTTASTAAQQLAMDRMAQLRASRWEVSWEGDPTRTNELVAGSYVDAAEALDLPQTGTVPLMATNHVTVTRLARSGFVAAARGLCLVAAEPRPVHQHPGELSGF